MGALEGGPPERSKRPGEAGALRDLRIANSSRLLLHDLEQLDVEHERRARLDLRRRAAITVRGVRGTDEPALAADLHLLHALRPALDDTVQRKRDRLAALDGAVEDRAVRELALVVDLDLVVEGRARTRTGLDRRDHRSRRGLDRALLCRRLVGECLSGLTLRRRRRHGARAL